MTDPKLAPAAHQETPEPPDELAEIRAFYDEHAPLDAHEQKTLIQRVGDEWHDFAAVVDHCSEVYDHFSRGRISKPMTLPREVIALADDFLQDDIDEAIKEAREEWKAEGAPARAAEWQPIESAPMGKVILLWRGGLARGYCFQTAEGSLGWATWSLDCDPQYRPVLLSIESPTHWMPLPLPPGALAGDSNSKR